MALHFMIEKGKYRDKSNIQIEKSLRSKGYSPLLISEKANFKLNEHSHPASHILVVINGQMQLALEGKQYLLKAGDAATIPPGLKHAAAFGSKGCAYFWVEH